MTQLCLHGGAILFCVQLWGEPGQPEIELTLPTLLYTWCMFTSISLNNKCGDAKLELNYEVNTFVHFNAFLVLQ